MYCAKTLIRQLLQEARPMGLATYGDVFPLWNSQTLSEWQRKVLDSSVWKHKPRLSTFKPLISLLFHLTIGFSHHPVCCLNQTLESVYNHPNLPVLRDIFSISPCGLPVLVPHSSFSDPPYCPCKQPPHLNLAWMGIHSLLQGSSWPRGWTREFEFQGDSLLSSNQGNPASLLVVLY